MAFQAHNFTLDDTYKLSDSLTANSAGVAAVGTVAYIDLGTVAPAFNVNTSTNKPFGRFAVVVDYGAIDVATGDERYQMRLEGCNATSFANSSAATGVYAVGLCDLGKAGYNSCYADTPANSRKVFYCDNVAQTSATDGGALQTMQYIRFAVTPYGTTPSITINKVWLVPL